MTEQTPTPDPVIPTPGPVRTEVPTPVPVEPKAERFAAYDKDLLKFVGGVQTTAAKARTVAKAKGSVNVEIRPVV